jgi:hypothetical protein
MLSALNISENLVNEETQLLFLRDIGTKVERRVKVLTDGKDDTADPCVPVEIVLPDRRKICALYCSGGRVLYYSSLRDLLHGGIRPFNKIEARTKDGNPLIMEPYHLAEAIWDTELIPYKKKLDNGEIVVNYIGHGGMMDRVDPLIPCSVINHNYRRSRHAFQVQFSGEGNLNSVKEIWTDLGPIHGNRPTSDGRWISQDENQMHAHGYGSRLVRDGTGQPWRDSEGFMWMTYEEVTEEKILGPGLRFPYGTKIFARRINDNLTLGFDKPILLSGYEPWVSAGKPFAAAKRMDSAGNLSGFLVEGPNPVLMSIQDREYWVIFFSAGDFVSTYGNFMMYREKSEGPIGPYRHVVDENNELVDLTSELVSKLALTWAGRLNPFYDEDGQLWGVMHGIFKSDIPDGWIKSGWPRTLDEFIFYARRIFLVPLGAHLKHDQPYVEVNEEKLI